MSFTSELALAPALHSSPSFYFLRRERLDDKYADYGGYVILLTLSWSSGASDNIVTGDVCGLIPGSHRY
jgi:hypothetical protein